MARAPVSAKSTRQRKKEQAKAYRERRRLRNQQNHYHECAQVQSLRLIGPTASYSEPIAAVDGLRGATSEPHGVLPQNEPALFRPPSPAIQRDGGCEIHRQRPNSAFETGSVAATPVIHSLQDEISEEEQQTSSEVNHKREHRAISQRELTRLRVQRFRARQHQQRLASVIPTETESGPCNPRNEVWTLPDLADLTLNEGSCNNEPELHATPDPIGAQEDGSSCIRQNDAWIGSQSASTPPRPESPLFLPDSPRSSCREARRTSQSSGHLDTILENFLRELVNDERRPGHYIDPHIPLYNQIFQKFFCNECDCASNSNMTECRYTKMFCLGSQITETRRVVQVHTLQEGIRSLQSMLPDLATIFGPTSFSNPRDDLPQWRQFLSAPPDEHVSLSQTNSSLSDSLEITREWDIDSIWLGARGLQAIRPPNEFMLSFLPSNALNQSTDQVMQPHSLEIAKTRHIHLSSFNATSVRFSVFVLFPNAAHGRRARTSATSNSLSLERQKDLYDKIIIPAVYETIPGPLSQEIPQSYDMLYAKSRSFQELPSNNRWQAKDESRSYRLQYGIPAEYLHLF